LTLIFLAKQAWNFYYKSCTVKEANTIKGKVFMKVIRFTFLIVAFLFTLPAVASEESHMTAAKKMVEAANLDKMLQEMYQQINDVIIRNLVNKDACLESIRTPLTELLSRYDHKILNADIVKTEIQKIYKQEFTEEEINSIVAFYQTPAGKKALEKAPLLATKGIEIAQKEINKSKSNGVMDELQKEVNTLIDGIDPTTMSAECKKKHDERKAQEKAALTQSVESNKAAPVTTTTTTPPAASPATPATMTKDTATTKEKAK
jgi:hypothetical protein